jgi:E3 ubiquitin-protein ligase SIAH1
MANVASDLRRVFLTELECRLCLEYMQPPIYLCLKGHSICRSCKPQLKLCPTCKTTFAPMRCLSLEKLSTKVDLPCRYKDSGCKAAMRGDSINEHQSVCPYGTYTCPFNCPGKCNRLSLVQHLKTKHKQTVTGCRYSSCYFKILNYSVTTEYRDVIVTNTEVFVRTIVIITDIWHFILQYIGPVKFAERFSYTVRLESRDSDVGSITITHRCQSINNDVNEICLACKCIMLAVEVVKCYLNDGQLSYRFKMARVQSGRRC